MAIEQTSHKDTEQRSVLTIRLSEEMHNKLRAAAHNTDVSVNKYVLDRFDRFFD
jgi:predicted HicB family RNase H-like nuclease